jgi:hypothetical protein
MPTLNHSMEQKRDLGKLCAQYCEDKQWIQNMRAERDQEVSINIHPMLSVGCSSGLTFVVVKSEFKFPFIECFLTTFFLHPKLKRIKNEISMIHEYFLCALLS